MNLNRSPVSGTLPKEVQETVIHGLLRQGPYLFVSLAEEDPIILNSELRPDEWGQIFYALFTLIGFEVHPETMQRILTALERQMDQRLARQGGSHGSEGL